MAEMEKDFQRIQVEKFEMLRDKCPWRFKARFQMEGDNNLCEAIFNKCTSDNCAVWYFVGK